jgi:Protein of unknown function (DUF3800)
MMLIPPRSGNASTPFGHFLEAILRGGGYIVEFVEAYFDESGTDDKSPMLCVAGYILEKTAAARMDADWLAVLNKFNLPYFRMSSCAHRTGPFKMLSEEDCIEVEKQMIAIIKASASFGVAVTVDTRAFARVMPERNFKEIGSPYSLCAHTCLTAVKSWATEKNFNGSISYMFEAGHKSQSEANGIMNRLFKNPQMRVAHRYSGHSFVDKALARPLQAADLLAWQWFLDRRRCTSLAAQSLSPRPRLDLQELVRDEKPPHNMMHFDEAKLRVIADIGFRTSYPLTYPWR